MILFGIEHTHLSERFIGFHRERAPLPVYAIEHGLDEDELDLVRLQVSAQIGARPSLQNAWWNQNYLPLLVVATEVGYRYRGTGTDFWPILTAELQAEDGYLFRQGLSQLFEIGHREHHLAKPGRSPWERHFPHIAWPIGNAGVPLELHRHLATALRQAVRDGMIIEQPEELLTYLHDLAAGRASRRFESWLERRDLAKEVIRRLLVGEQEGWLFEGFLSRLDDDLKKDRHTRRAIVEARRKVAKSTSRVLAIPRTRFVLELEEMKPTALLVRGPTLGRQDREDAISMLGISWDTLRAGRGGSTMDLAQFLAGGEMVLGVVEDMQDDVLLRGDHRTGVTGAASTLLERLQPRTSDFFLLQAGERRAEAVFPDDNLKHDARLLQIQRTGTSERLQYRLLTAATDGTILKKHGFGVETVVPPFRITGLPMSGAAPVFASGFPVLVFARSDAVVPMLDGKIPSSGSMAFADGEWQVFFPDGGNHEVKGAEEDESVEFAVVEPPDIDPATITISPEVPSLRDLETGVLSLRAVAPLPLEDLELKLSLFLSTGELIRVDTRITRLPTAIGGNAPVMQEVRKALAELASEPSDARLLVEMQGFAPFEVWLRPPGSDIRFDLERGIWVDMSEERTWASLVATGSNPFPKKNADEDADVVLHLPEAPDQDALPVGFVTSSASTIHLGDMVGTPVSIPKVRREDTADGAEAGSGDLVHAYLAWKLSEANSWVAQFRRRAVEVDLERSVVTLFCGQEWAAIEGDLDLSILTPHGALFRAASRHGLLSGGDLPNLREPSDRMFLRERLGERFRQLVFDLRTTLEDCDDDLAGDLDFAVIEAYEDLRTELKKQGRDAFDEVDVYFTPEQWRAVLISAADITLLQDFDRFVLPEMRWQRLVTAWYDDVSEDALLDLLVDSHVDASRRSGFRWIGRAELRTMLQLWLSPSEVIRTENWRATLAKGLSDRQTSRAVRYVALRRKLAMLDLPSGVLS